MISKVETYYYVINAWTKIENLVAPYSARGGSFFFFEFQGEKVGLPSGRVEISCRRKEKERKKELTKLGR